MRNLLLIGFLLLQGCASLPKNTSNDISIGSLTDLARTSYHRGCTEGLKLKSDKVHYIYCRQLSIKHAKEIQEILKSGPNKQGPDSNEK